jgi:adenylate cyclase
MVMFPRPDMTDNGVALSFATNVPGGFNAEQVAALDLLMPALALAGRTISIARTAHEALGVYLGPRTAQPSFAFRRIAPPFHRFCAAGAD